jgi:hypothetical protein
VGRQEVSKAAGENIVLTRIFLLTFLFHDKKVSGFWGKAPINKKPQTLFAHIDL